MNEWLIWVQLVLYTTLRHHGKCGRGDFSTSSGTPEKRDFHLVATTEKKLRLDKPNKFPRVRKKVPISVIATYVEAFLLLVWKQ